MFPIRDHNPSGRTAWVTRGLVVLNVGIFLAYWLTIPAGYPFNLFLFNWGVVPAAITGGSGYHGLLTSMFLHAGWMHLLGNMLFLWVFGDNMEDQMGHLPYLGFYLAGGVAAALAQVWSEPLSLVPMVGASGAIAAVLGGYLLMFPRARVDVLFIIVIFIRTVPIPAFIVLGVWFGLQVFGVLSAPGEQGGVAYWAHAGGFVAGVALALPLWLSRGGPQFWSNTHGAPPKPEATYDTVASRIPMVRRSGGRQGPWGR